jgi:hypothetical protein
MLMPFNVHSDPKKLYTQRVQEPLEALWKSRSIFGIRVALKRFAIQVIGNWSVLAASPMASFPICSLAA